MENREKLKEIIRKIIKEERLNEQDSDVFDDNVLKSINWSPLEKECSKRLGVSIKIDEMSVKGRRYFEIGYSKNLIDKAGIFGATFKEVYCSNFNSSYNVDGIWLTMSLKWKHKDGGSNAATFLTATYEFNKKKWILK